jgi:hypothetical protein
MKLAKILSSFIALCKYKVCYFLRICASLEIELYKNKRSRYEKTSFTYAMFMCCAFQRR